MIGWDISEREALESEIINQQHIIQDAQARLQHLLAKQKAMFLAEQSTSKERGYEKSDGLYR